MAIKKVGGGAPAPIQPTETTATKSRSFADVSSASRAAQKSPSQSADAVHRAVSDVAEGIRAGRVGSEPEARVDAVIARIVELQSPEGTSRSHLRERIEDAQLALGDHPGFSARVTAMLDEVLAAE